MNPTYSEFERAILQEQRKPKPPEFEDPGCLYDQLHDEQGAVEGCYRTRSAPTE